VKTNPKHNYQPWILARSDWSTRCCRRM